MKKITAIVLAAFTAAALASCAREAETEAPPQTEATTETTEEVTVEETLVPFDDSAYEEFAEPVAYNVIADTDSYTDASLSEVSGRYVAGAMVIGLGSDGNYVITDTQEVVPLEALEAFQ